MAYNRYQYETSPRKLQPEFETVKKQQHKKNTKKNTKVSNKNEKKEKVRFNKATGYVVIGFLLLFTMSYRNALISQNYSEVKKLEKQLSTMEKENEQLKVNIETNLNLKNIEKSAEERIGMQKISNIQTVYVNLPREDYIEPAVEEVEITKEDGWLKEIWNFILDCIK